MFEARGGNIALNLARPDDRALLPALFAADDFDPYDNAAITARVASADPDALVARGRAMGLAMAAECESVSPAAACVAMTEAPPSPPRATPPRVLDLSALWAGPLAAHLLWLAGADVVKLENRTRPDAMRQGAPAFFALLNQGKASVVLDFANQADRNALGALIATSDIVIEAARPRALAHLGIDADHIVRSTPGLIWITITGHGALGEAANWVGFGDDCGVAGGLTAALRAASGTPGFVGDAIADPLTGIFAARLATKAWRDGQGGRFGIAMSAVAATALAEARLAPTINADLAAWQAAAGQPFPPLPRRPMRARLHELGADTQARLGTSAAC
ncbi:MAG TPA: CoA transferase [Acetobacteraceae bacterium]|nr:CoA transferase [Acetobacteraceae bacterium]